MFWGQDRLTESEEWFLEALRVYRIVHGENSPSVATMLQYLGLVQQSKGQLDEAFNLLKQSLRVTRRVHGDRSVEAANLIDSMGTTLFKLGQQERAMEKYEQALEMIQDIEGSGSETAILVVNNMALVLESQGKHTEAIELHQRLLAQNAALGADTDAKVMQSMLNQGISHISAGQLDEAYPKLKKGLDIVRRLHPEKTSTEAKFLGAIAAVYGMKGQLQDALSMGKRTIKMYNKTLGPDSVEAGSAHKSLATTLERMDRWDEAMEMHEKALEILKKAVGPDHERVASVLHGMAVTKSNSGDIAAAVPLLKEARRIFTKKGIRHGDSQSVDKMLRDFGAGV